jgi:hypothetical protein
VEAVAGQDHRGGQRLDGLGKQPELATAGVLHYDARFDVLAEALEFESRWIAPRGSL